MSGNCHFFLYLLWAIQALSSLIVWQLAPNVHLFTLGVFRVATQHVEEGWSYRNLCLFTIFTLDRDRFHSFIKECNFEDFFPAFFSADICSTPVHPIWLAANSDVRILLQNSEAYSLVLMFSLDMKTLFATSIQSNSCSLTLFLILIFDCILSTLSPVSANIESTFWSKSTFLADLFFFRSSIAVERTWISAEASLLIIFDKFSECLWAYDL